MNDEIVFETSAHVMANIILNQLLEDMDIYEGAPIDESDIAARMERAENISDMNHAISQMEQVISFLSEYRTNKRSMITVSDTCNNHAATFRAEDVGESKR